MGTAGVFDSVDVCLELACGPTFATGLKFFASQGVSLVLRGQAGHSGIRHLRGINAVDAMMFVAGSLDYLRANIGERGIVNFTIKESRSALAAGRVGIRATTTDLAAAYVGHVKRLAELARDVSGARLEVKDEIGYRENVKCPSLAHMIMNNFQVLGFDAEWHLDKEPQGSSDVGDVSHRVPTESIRIGLGQGLVPHTDAYREAAGGEPGHRVVVNGGKALCACLVDLLVYDSSGLVERARAEFKNNCSV
jgi:metal-dependent amidase/aminoacylase/carboxypeptidase family protein